MKSNWLCFILHAAEITGDGSRTKRERRAQNVEEKEIGATQDFAAVRIEFDGWMDGQTDGMTDGLTDGQADGRTGGWVDGWVMKTLY